MLLSSAAASVTVCAVFQSVVVKVKLLPDGVDTVMSVSSSSPVPSPIVTVTLAVGSTLSFTL